MQGLCSLWTLVMYDPPKCNAAFSRGPAQAKVPGFVSYLVEESRPCVVQVGAFFTSIPQCVLGGMTTFLFAGVCVSGIKVLMPHAHHLPCAACASCIIRIHCTRLLVSSTLHHVSMVAGSPHAMQCCVLQSWHAWLTTPCSEHCLAAH